jgi:drug/metabolite transporter (DMT)-like permease
MKSPSPQVLAILAATLSSTLGGTAIVATRFVVPEAGVLPVVFLRFAGAALVFIAFIVPRQGFRLERGDLPVFVALGLVQYAFFPWCFTHSLALIPAARGALVLATQPLVTLALSAAVGRERLTTLKVVGGLVALAAVAYALGDRIGFDGPAHDWSGEAWMFGAVLASSVYNVTSGPLIQRHGALQASYKLIPVGVVFIAAWITLDGEWGRLADIDTAGWIAVAWLGTLGGALTFWLWTWALSHTTPARVALCVTFNPVSAAALGALVLDEPVTWRVIGGLAGIFVALVLMNWTVLRPPVAALDAARATAEADSA